jgi:1-acyl-sn-glycerol-3-phosphate acyltransferase
VGARQGAGVGFVTAPAATGRAAGRPGCPIRRNRVVYWLSRTLALWFCKVWNRLRAEDRDVVPATGAVLLVANHASYLDPPLVGITCRRVITFLAQAGLAKLGPMRWWLDRMGVTLIDRRAPSKDALRLIADCLAAGEAVCLFPEGTRSADGTVAEFRSGVEFLVRRTGAPVVPIGLDGSARAFPRGAKFPRPVKLVVRYGEVWPAERVLAPGGIHALRARVAELAHAPLRESPGREPAQTGSSPAPASADPGT